MQCLHCQAARTGIIPACAQTSMGAPAADSTHGGASALPQRQQCRRRQLDWGGLRGRRIVEIAVTCTAPVVDGMLAARTRCHDLSESGVSFQECRS